MLSTSVKLHERTNEISQWQIQLLASVRSKLNPSGFFIAYLKLMYRPWQSLSISTHFLKNVKWRTHLNANRSKLGLHLDWQRRDTVLTPLKLKWRLSIMICVKPHSFSTNVFHSYKSSSLAWKSFLSPLMSCSCLEVMLFVENRFDTSCWR